MAEETKQPDPRKPQDAESLAIPGLESADMQIDTQRIELRRHVTTRRTPVGMQPVDFRQYFVLLWFPAIMAYRQVGLIGCDSHCRFNPTPLAEFLSLADREAVADAAFRRRDELEQHNR